MTALAEAPPGVRRPVVPARRARGVTIVVGVEAAATCLGFVTLGHVARRLGPSSFTDVEYALAVTAWLLVIVRGGPDVIATREAARRPRLIGRLTDLLLGLRLIAAVAAYGFAVAFSTALAPDRVSAVAVGGLALFASAMVADVGPRALGAFGWLGPATVVRACVHAAGAVVLVRSPGHATLALSAFVGAETAAAVVAWFVQRRLVGGALPHWRGRASRALASRGAVAGLARFGRVTLFGLDVLALGFWTGPEVGGYAAARRLVFAAAGLAMIAVASFGPSMATAWAVGPGEGRSRALRAAGRVGASMTVASLLLMATSGRLMPLLFGGAYDGAGLWLVLAAARLPFLVMSCLSQEALTAFRREGWCLRLVGCQVAVGVPVMAVLAGRFGPVGAGLTALAVDAIGAAAGWALLSKLWGARRDRG